jgi:hypothetical protein
VGGIYGDILDWIEPVKTSNITTSPYDYIMLAQNTDKANQYGSDWYQVGLGWWTSTHQTIHVQLNNAHEPLWDFDWQSVDSYSSSWYAQYDTFTETWDPCNACTYDQYNQPASGWAYMWVGPCQGCTNTLILQKPITFTPDHAEYSGEVQNSGDQMSGALGDYDTFSRFHYYFPAGSGGQWYWMGDDGPPGSSAWGLFNDDPFGANYPKDHATADLALYDTRCKWSPS